MKYLFNEYLLCNNITDFENIKNRENIYLYAGDLKQWNFVPVNDRFFKTGKRWIGLTLPKYGKTGVGTQDENHIWFDILNRMPLDDSTVDIYQSEDVHEHLEYDQISDQINEIYRVLKPGGLFRLSVPDYNCDILYNRTDKNSDGSLKFDSGGGGYYDEDEKKVKDNGHVWFPNYDNVKMLLENTNFSNINFLNYWIDKQNFIIKDIDYTNGYIHRTPDNDKRVQNPRSPMSIVVDCYK